MISESSKERVMVKVGIDEDGQFVNIGGWQ